MSSRLLSEKVSFRLEPLTSAGSGRSAQGCSLPVSWGYWCPASWNKMMVFSLCLAIGYLCCSPFPSAGSCLGTRGFCRCWQMNPFGQGWSPRARCRGAGFLDCSSPPVRYGFTWETLLGLCRSGEAAWHTAGTILPGHEQLQQLDRIPAKSWSAGGGIEMPFHPRHEASYQWPTLRCGWVSGAGAAFQCCETRGAQRCQSGCEVQRRCVEFGMSLLGSYNPKLVVFDLSCWCLIWDVPLGSPEQFPWAVPHKHSCSGVLLLYFVIA